MIVEVLPKEKGKMICEKINLHPKSELRILYNFMDFVYIWLIQGRIEING